MNRSYHIGQPLCDSHEFPERRDPDYDDPRPLEWRELCDPRLWVAAVVGVAAVIAFCVLLFTLVPGPHR